MKPFLLYTAARLGLFLACLLVVLSVLGVADVAMTSTTLLLAALGAMVVSAALSYALLRRLRDDLALTVQQRADQVQRRVEESRRREDDDGLD